MANQKQKFITYNKSIIDRLKPYGPSKIKWDAGREKYENVSLKYFEEYEFGSKLFCKSESIEVPKIDNGKVVVTTKEERGWYNPFKWFGDDYDTEEKIIPRWQITCQGWLDKDKTGFDSRACGSFYLKKQSLGIDEWSENAILPSNTFIGNYIFEQNGNYKTENRRYILVPDDSAKKDLKRKLLEYCGTDDEFFSWMATRMAYCMSSYFNHGYIEYTNNKVPTTVGYVRGSKIRRTELRASRKPRKKTNAGNEVFQYCLYRKAFENFFNGPLPFYNQDLQLSKPNTDKTKPAEPGTELFNQYGIDGINNMGLSIPIESSGVFGFQYPYDKFIRNRNTENWIKAKSELEKNKISISSKDIVRYITDIFDVAVLLLKNDSSVYKEIADKLFPYVSEKGKEEFQKQFWISFTTTFVDNDAINLYKRFPILINSEIGDYSTAEKVSKIIASSKKIILSLPSDNKNIQTDLSLIRETDGSYPFSEGYGYLDPDVDSAEYNWPWPPVENESDLKNQFHSLSLQNFASLDLYAKTCGVVASLIFNDETWIYYNDRSFIQFVANHLIIAEDSNEMAIEITKEKGPDDEIRERTTLNEFDIRQSVRDVTNSIWYLDDYNWSMDRKNLNELGMEITDFQKLRIYEFQPDKQMSFKRLTTSLIQAAQSAFNSLGGNNALANIVKPLVEAGITKTVNSFSATNIESKNYATNVDWVAELLQGTWVGQYDVPFFGKNFLKADTTDKWAMGNLADSAEFLKNDLTTNVQDIPTWAYSPGKAELIPTTIYLLNEDVDSIIKNLKFLHSITAGAWWVQTSFIGYRQPNLYRVLCPGRFIMLYASMAITVEMIGKIRRYSQQDAEEMFGKGSESNDFMPFKLYTSAGEGNCNIPEAYKLTLKLQDLTPQVFNVMANFFTNGYGNESTKLYPNIFVKQLSADVGDKITSNLSEAYSVISKDVKSD